LRFSKRAIASGVAALRSCFLVLSAFFIALLRAAARLFRDGDFAALVTLIHHIYYFSELLQLSIKWWYFWATHSRIPEMVQAAKNLKDNCWDRLINYLKYRLTNAAAEAMNGLIQSAKRKARGFRTFSCFHIAIYLLGSRLKFDLPHPIPAYPHNS